jgi:hypothetical protein
MFMRSSECFDWGPCSQSPQAHQQFRERARYKIEHWNIHCNRLHFQQNAFRNKSRHTLHCTPRQKDEAQAETQHSNNNKKWIEYYYYYYYTNRQQIHTTHTRASQRPWVCLSDVCECAYNLESVCLRTSGRPPLSLVSNLSGVCVIPRAWLLFKLSTRHRERGRGYTETCAAADL